jgi:type III pantothenate kinase
MQAGLLYGFAGLVEYLVNKTKKELGKECIVVATGGLGEIIAREAKCIDYSDRILTLEGLRLLYELNN